jgi:hypothetical protein
MKVLVESLKRLYKANKVTDDRLKEMIGKSITEEEYKEIVG